MKPLREWAMAFHGRPISGTARRLRAEAVVDFVQSVDISWPKLRKMGYSAVRVSVVGGGRLADLERLEREVRAVAESPPPAMDARWIHRRNLAHELLRAAGLEPEEE